LITLSWVTAYHSFGGEVEASNTPTIRRLTPSRRHQLSRIARAPATHCYSLHRQLFNLTLINDLYGTGFDHYFL
jgi:hypothetical protein